MSNGAPLLSSLALVQFLSGVAAVGLAVRNLPTRFFHYSSAEELDQILAAGSIGRRAAWACYTTADYADGWVAQRELALSSRPQAKLSLTLYPSTDLLLGPLPVWSKFGQPGGGVKYFTPLSIELWSRQPVAQLLRDGL